ncbi:hypothetical protein K6U51_09170, partial [Vibrio fluvialis]|uniref:hypothetical protein n=1 Tax=Vibrio fluvialis TaxID=676 RepID=UPI001EECE64E
WFGIWCGFGHCDVFTNVILLIGCWNTHTNSVQNRLSSAVCAVSLKNMKIHVRPSLTTFSWWRSK